MENRDNSHLLSEPSVSHRKPRSCRRKYEVPERMISLSGNSNSPAISNTVVNTKYHPLSFIPLFLFYQFKQPLNLFFLVIALSQFYPPLQVGFLFTYIAPLALVLMITMSYMMILQDGSGIMRSTIKCIPRLPMQDQCV